MSALSAAAPSAGTLEALRQAVLAAPCVLPRGGGSKPALSAAPAGTVPLDLSALSGVLAYQPEEFTFTALAGTPVAEVAALLARHGQYLPFDPPLAERGATLGGTVAAGLSGPGRYRYGGVRDFILGVRLIDGNGEVVRGGGQVVKNAAGFDLPKLMVGSLGRLGVLVELSFKVFPRPEDYLTVRLDAPTLPAALEALNALYVAPLDIDALDLLPAESGAAVLLARVGGLRAALPARAERVRAVIGGGAVVEGVEEAALWHAARELTWAPPGWTLARVPLTPARIPGLEAALAAGPSLRRYSVGGQLAWVASPQPAASLHARLAELGLAGLVIFGAPGPVLIGRPTGAGFGRRVKQALDPLGRFGPLEV